MPFAPLEGTTLGKHVLVRRLGEGSLGTVWEARKLDTDEHVALKIIEPEASSLEAVFVRMQRAAKTARRVDHAGMATVRSIEMLEAEGVVLLESELLVGMDLGKWMKRPDVEIEDTLRLVRHALRPIAAAHARRDEHGAPLGLAHRDLTPANIFVLDAPTWEGTTRSLLPVKVLDFGLARPEGEPVVISPKMRGTMAYTSPEVFLGEAHFGAPVDVFSMGAILFEILAARRPFHGNPVEIAAQIVATRAPSLAEVAPWVDPAWHALVDRCLEKDPNDRFQDAGELARAMDALLGADASERTEWVQVTLVDEQGGGDATDDAADDDTRTTSPRTTTLEAKPRPVVADPSKMPARPATTTTTATATATATAPQTAKPVAKPAAAESSSATLYVLLLGLAAALAIGLYVSRQREGAHTDPDPGDDPGEVAEDARGATGRTARTGADNAFIRIQGAVKRRERYFSNYWGDYQIREVTVSLGLATDNAPATLYGFRPRREIFAPEATYAIQAHEVTYAELEPFLRQHPEHIYARPAHVPADASARAQRPAVGVSWELASAYCASLGGALPTEEQWEYAARGDARRVHPWGNEAIDAARTRVYAGPTATEVDVGTSSQDVTPEGVRDLAGNAREWTDGFFRDPLVGTRDRQASANETLRAIRGLPMAAPLPQALPEVSTAYREPVCGVSACAGGAADVLAHVGFRCVKTVPGEPAAASSPADASADR